MSRPATHDLEALAELALFRGLAREDLATLEGLLRRSTFPAGTLLMTQEQPGEVVYVVLSGTVKIYLAHEDGTEVILAFLGAGQTVGEMSLIDSAGRSANVVTVDESTLLWMDRTAFQTCLKTVPALGHNLITLLCGRLRLANEQIQALSSLDVAGRVARQLLAFAEQYGQAAEPGIVRIPLRLTQSDLASIVGTSRERVNHVMVRFKEFGYISVDQRSQISIHDRKALAARCR